MNSSLFFFSPKYPHYSIKYSLHVKCIFKTEYPVPKVSIADSHHKLFNLVA